MNSLALEATDYPIDTACHRFNILEPAQEPSLHPRCRVVNNVFYLDGVVDHQMTYEIKVNYPDIKRVELNSYGGNVEHAYELAKLIRDRNLHTNVRMGAKCGSACTLLLQAGRVRTAHSSVRLMYHPVRRSSDWFLDGNMDRHSNLIVSVQGLVEYNILTSIYD